MEDYKYYAYFEYPQFGIYLKVESNKLDIYNTSFNIRKDLCSRLRNPVKFIVQNFCIPLSYDVDTQMFEIDGSLLLYRDSYKYYNELPNGGILFTTTYLSLKTINQAMKGKFPKGTDLKTNIFKTNNNLFKEDE